MGSLSSLNSIFVDRGVSVKYQVRKLCVRASVSVAAPKNTRLEDIQAQKFEKFRIGVLGASGYTGSEIIRLLSNHPNFQITLMTADRKAGQSIRSVFPHLVKQELPNMVAVIDADFSNVDAVFCCLPHGTTQEIIKGLPPSLKIVDLSADFRLQDVDEYEEWYGQPHRAHELQREAVYGLTEISRSNIQNARLVANPGCYPTSIQLPLIPLIKANLIEVKNIIVDSKSGVSGAGRGPKEAYLYTEIAEGIHSYGLTRHRHESGSLQAPIIIIVMLQEYWEVSIYVVIINLNLIKIVVQSNQVETVTFNVMFVAKFQPIGAMLFSRMEL